MLDSLSSYHTGPNFLTVKPPLNYVVSSCTDVTPCKGVILLMI